MSVFVITGATSGIGRALALRAARAGYDLVAVGRNRDALAELEARVKDERGRIVVDVLDCSVAANAKELVALAHRSFGRIDVLVNNAGQVASGPLVAQSDDALQVQFGTHVIFPVALVREALPLLRAGRGHVFMLGSGVARIPVPGLGAYPPSKAALRSATAILRRELKPLGIAVTYVDPGAVATQFMSRAGFAGSPQRLLTTPEEVARRILAAVATRPRTLNAVPWQTPFIALAELFPRATDLVLERAPALVGASPSPRHAEPSISAGVEAPPSRHAEPVEARRPAELVEAPSPAAPPTFEAALAPIRRRMERVKLSEDFVRGLFAPGAELDAAEVALRWAGMPNKNERAVTVATLDALADAGYLVRDGDRYRVARLPD